MMDQMAIAGIPQEQYAGQHAGVVVGAELPGAAGAGVGVSMFNDDAQRVDQRSDQQQRQPVGEQHRHRRNESDHYYQHQPATQHPLFLCCALLHGKIFRADVVVVRLALTLAGLRHAHTEQSGKQQALAARIQRLLVVFRVAL